MEHFTSPADVLVAFVAFPFLIAFAVLIGAPLAMYRAAERARRSSWDTTRPTLLFAGAYRATVALVPIRVRMPRVIVAASLATFYMLVPSLAVLPLAMLGVCREIETRTLGPAIVFGAQGVALSIATTVIGVRLLRRASLGRGALAIASWEVAFAVALAIAMLSGVGADFAPLFFSYAIATALHAFVLLAAIVAHQRATLARDEAHDQR